MFRKFLPAFISISLILLCGCSTPENQLTPTMEINPLPTGTSAANLPIPNPQNPPTIYPPILTQVPTNPPYPFPRNTPTSTSTPSPTYTPTPTYTPSPSPTLEQVSLSCQKSQNWTTCTDPLLGIEYQYPATWGDISGFINPYSGITGLSYYYEFHYIATNNRPFIQAGGEIKDFNVGREAFITDFRGFGTSTGSEYCRHMADVLSCKEIQPNVIFVIDAPIVSLICKPGPGLETDFHAKILINLPDNPRINGFLFVSTFLSPVLKHELDAIIGLNAPGPPENCTDATQKQYDQKVQEIYQQYLHNTLDEISSHNIQDLLHLASSIKFH
jgi:hypothetical protein